MYMVHIHGFIRRNRKNMSLFIKCMVQNKVEAQIFLPNFLVDLESGSWFECRESNTESMTQEALEGVLQQQIVSAEGLYGWKRRYFKLEPSLATLDAYESESPSGTSAASHSLQNVRVAKVWGPNESGFDVFWKSGDSWSLLADDEEGAKIWVQYFNITRKLLDQSQAPGATAANGSAPVTEMTSTADDSMNTINMMNNSAFGASIRLQSLEHEYAALNEQTLREKEDAAEAQQHYLRLHRHKVTQVDQEANSAANSQHRSPPRSSSSANGVPAPSMRIAEPAIQTSLQEMMEENTALHRRETALQNAHERELETIMANHEGELLVLRNELIQERKRYTLTRTLALNRTPTPTPILTLTLTKMPTLTPILTGTRHCGKRRSLRWTRQKTMR